MPPWGSGCWTSCRMKDVDPRSDALYVGIDYDKLAREFYDATLGTVGTDSNKVYETVIKAVGIPLRRGYTETVHCSNGCGSSEEVKLYKSPYGEIVEMIKKGGVERLGKALERYAPEYKNCNWADKKYVCTGYNLVSRIIFDEMFGDDRGVLGLFSGIGNWYSWTGVDDKDYIYWPIFDRLDWPGADNEDCMTWVMSDGSGPENAQGTSEDIEAAEAVCRSIK